MGRLRVKKARKVKQVQSTPTVNKAGGKAFEVSDASQKLLHLVGHMFNEPKYYGDAKSPDKSGNQLDSEAVALIETTKQVLNGPTPEDAFAIARWARDRESGLKLRTTPTVVLAVACEDARPGSTTLNDNSELRRHGTLVRKYAPSILQRADEPVKLFESWRALFGGPRGNTSTRTRAIPRALCGAIETSLSKISEKNLAKYAGSADTSLRDVVRICARNLISNPRFLYFVDKEKWLKGNKGTKGKSFKPHEKTPVLWARHLLAQKTEWDTEAADLAEEAQVEWEMLLSQFGGDPKSKAKLWAHQLPRLGYLASIRNLRNLVQNGIDIGPVLAKIENPEEVKKSGMLPFQYLNTLSALGLTGQGKVSGYSAWSRGTGDHQTEPLTEVEKAKWGARIVDAVDSALDSSVENLPSFQGRTAIFVDLSGSMDQAPSTHNTATMKQIASIMASILAKKSEDTIIIGFANEARVIPFRKKDSILTNSGVISQTQVGEATYAHKAAELLTSTGTRVDRIIIVSDMQCYEGWGGTDFQTRVSEYNRRTGSGAKIHSINLAGTTTSIVPDKDKKVFLYSGFSENLVKLMVDAEQGAAEANVERVLPTLSEIRKKWYLK